ncbi:hypothetical protein G6F50_007755 [Rhizopus delemar]|uniref:Uncharacterized protein n=2 Tax=Rhizopus TaxID=4842 RepID=A0A9P6YZX1_9FUNG|nr:hypothetical protein G6F51_008525 [Rhizopus arrhizus]KAG1567931.1 hypothetical protein G6F50_007755 [Rhizopus delemar]
MDSQFPEQEDLNNTVDSYSVTINGFIFCDEREPFSVAHKWTRVAKGKPGCMAHKTVACDECFNWGEQLYRGIHGGRKPRVSRIQRKSRDNTDKLS